jgi:hypothetical protein
MRKFLSLALFVLAVHMPCVAFSSISLSIGSGDVVVSASNFSGGSQAFSDPAGFAVDGLTRTADVGNASTSATYNWSNADGSAIFEAIVNSITLSDGGRFVEASQSFAFTLNESAYYALDGHLRGRSLAKNNQDESGLWVYLINRITGQFVGYEEEYDTNSSTIDLLTDGTQQGDYFRNEGQLTGQIGPGEYRFLGLVRLRDNGDGAASIAASGFTQLTLTAVNTVTAPEPLSLLVWCGLLACGTVLRSRSPVDRSPRANLARNRCPPPPQFWRLDTSGLSNQLASSKESHDA